MNVVVCICSVQKYYWHISQWYPAMLKIWKQMSLEWIHRKKYPFTTLELIRGREIKYLHLFLRRSYPSIKSLNWHEIPWLETGWMVPVCLTLRGHIGSCKGFSKLVVVFTVITIWSFVRFNNFCFKTEKSWLFDVIDVFDVLSCLCWMLLCSSRFGIRKCFCEHMPTHPN